MNKELLYIPIGGNDSDEEKQIMDWAESSPKTVKYLQDLQERKIGIITNSRPIHPITHGVKSPAFNLWKIVSIAASVALLVSLSWTLLNTANKKQEGLQAVLVPAGQHVQLILKTGLKSG